MQIIHSGKPLYMHVYMLHRITDRLYKIFVRLLAPFTRQIINNIYEKEGPKKIYVSTYVYTRK